MAWPSNSARTKTWGTEILTSGDLDGQFDVLHTYNNDQLNGTTGHGHTGGTNDAPKVSLSTSVTGTLPLGNGGTGQTTLAAFLNLIYPVGSVYCNASVATNPGTLLGFGTWTAIGGYTLVGYLAADPNFGATGVVAAGEVTHVLSTAEMPSHTHVVNLLTQLASGSTAQQPSQSGGGGSYNVTSTATGGGGAHNNIQPSYVVYIWQRTA